MATVVLGRKDCNWRATLWSAEKAVTAAYAVASVWEERVFFPQDSEKTDDMSSELVRVAIN